MIRGNENSENALLISKRAQQVSGRSHEAEKHAQERGARMLENARECLRNEMQRGSGDMIL